MGWYADPLSRAEAQQLLQRGQLRAQRAYRCAESALTGELEGVIGHFALGQSVDGEIEALSSAAVEPRVRALVILIHGQLLMSRRIVGALERLTQGFELARDEFLPQDFFTVMKRHELLAELPLYRQARASQALSTLLVEAGVIRRLRGRRRICARHDERDTMG